MAARLLALEASESPMAAPLLALEPSASPMAARLLALEPSASPLSLEYSVDIETSESVSPAADMLAPEAPELEQSLVATDSPLPLLHCHCHCLTYDF